MKKLSLSELNRLSVEKFKEIPKSPVVIVLNDIRSLNNVGSAFRTADAFAIEEVILCGITGKPPHRDIQKTALGATESVKWAYHADIIKVLPTLKEKGYLIVAVEQTDSSVMLETFSVDSTKKYCFIFGNEVKGVANEVLPLCDYSVEIPQYGTKHSFNISVSIGIILWEYTRQRLVL